jgi:hypothetical protein
MPETVKAMLPAVERAIRERRLWLRHASSVDSRCQPIGGGPDSQWSATIENLSRGGLLLLVNRRFEEKTLLQIEWKKADEDCTHTLLARVAHVRPDVFGNWAVGCAFGRLLCPEELRALLDNDAAIALMGTSPKTAAVPV